MKILIFVVKLLLISSALYATDVGDPAPDFNLQKHGGGTGSLTDYAGKVIYINWFGWNCPICKAEGNSTQVDIVNNYSSNPNFVGIGIDAYSGSNASNVASFAEFTGITYDLFIGGRNIAGEYSTTFQYSMVIDSDGIIQWSGRTSQTSAINSVIEGLLTPTAIEDKTTSPVKFELKNNYPNPFNPETRIPFSVNKTQNIKLEIYNISGKLIRTIIDAPFAKGNFEASWNGINDQGIRVASGVYFSRLQGESTVKMKQLLLIK